MGFFLREPSRGTGIISPRHRGEEDVRKAGCSGSGGRYVSLGAVAALGWFALYWAESFRRAGVFEYPLDDVYIHLAMASGIARGTYGVNPGEAASAASLHEEDRASKYIEASGRNILRGAASLLLAIVPTAATTAPSLPHVFLAPVVW